MSRVLFTQLELSTYGRMMVVRGWLVAGLRRPVACSSRLLSTAPSESHDEAWMEKEIESYTKGKKRLAEMMGADPATFTDKDVQDALRYLLPTSLTAKDARPFLKHPSKVFPARIESKFDAHGRPLDAAFYTGCVAYHDLTYSIYRQLGNVMDTNEEETPVIRDWVKKETMEKIIAEELSDEQYKDIVQRLTHLSKWISSPDVKEFLERYRPPSAKPQKQVKSEDELSKGLLEAIGKRKTSLAIVKLKRGEGEITVNGRPFINFFPVQEDREQVLYPLIVTKTLGRFDVTARVSGGGTTGQAGAIRLGISKALMQSGSHDDELEESGLLIRDPRAVERKKPGQKKARKKFAWVKR